MNPDKSSLTPAEHAALITMKWTVIACAAALPLLLVPQGGSLLIRSTVHLGVVVAFGIALAFRMAPLTDGGWFLGVNARRRLIVTATWTVVLVAGASGLVALTSSAALRYDPSLQYLQVLSALDISWAGAAIVIGLRWRAGLRVAAIGALMLGVVCIWSIWRYLAVVGFGPDGSWIVDAGRLMTLVIPYDMAAAVIAVAALLIGARALRARA